MIRVTIDVIPFGREKDRSTLYTVDISNNLSGNPVMGNYNYTVNGVRAGSVQGFNRRFGALELVRKVLKEVARI